MDVWNRLKWMMGNQLLTLKSLVSSRHLPMLQRECRTINITMNQSKPTQLSSRSTLMWTGAKRNHLIRWSQIHMQIIKGMRDRHKLRRRIFIKIIKGTSIILRYPIIKRTPSTLIKSTLKDLPRLKSHQEHLNQSTTSNHRFDINSLRDSKNTQLRYQDSKFPSQNIIYDL